MRRPMLDPSYPRYENDLGLKLEAFGSAVLNWEDDTAEGGGTIAWVKPGKDLTLTRLGEKRVLSTTSPIRRAVSKFEPKRGDRIAPQLPLRRSRIRSRWWQGSWRNTWPMTRRSKTPP